MTGYIRR